MSLYKVTSKGIQLFIARNFVWFLTVGLIVLFGLVRPTFFSYRVISYMFYVASLTGILILGQALCLISGNIDVSIDRIAGLSAVVGGLLLARWTQGLPAILGIVFVILLATLLGAVNGFFVGIVGVNSFIVTLSTYLVYMYTAFYIETSPIGGYELPPIFMALGSASVGPIQASSLLFLAIGILLHFMLKHTSFGVKIYATGADTATAKALGVNTRNTVFYTYTLIGAVAGVGGLAYAGFTGAVTNNLAMGEVFWTFAGTIIAGVAMRGGSGSMINVMGGALFIGLVTTGTLVFQVTATQRMVIAGIIILISILISRLRETWEEHLLKT